MERDAGPTSASFAGVLSEAIQARGLSLERIRARLEAAGVAVSIATLSYWQSGRSLPTRARSYHTLVELEKVLTLEAGHLTRFTHTADGRRRHSLFPWETVLPVGEVASGIVNDLGIDMRGQLTRVTMQDRMVIRADRTEKIQVSSLLWRAERNGLHRWPLVVEQDADDQTSVPAVAAVSGCQVGEIIEVPERHLLVAEMLAPRPLRRGDHLLSIYRTTFASTNKPSYRLTRSVTDPVRSVSLIAQFDERALPANLRYTYATTMDGEPELTAELELANNEVQITQVDTPPGVYSILWDWD
ncbi:MAG: hypothetical protein ACK5LS_06880 [Propioniciclava sp.]